MFGLTPVKLYAFGAVLLFMVGQSIAIHHYRSVLADTRADVKRLNESLSLANAANGTNVEAIAKLKAANERFVELAQAAEGAAEAARVQLENAQQAASNERRKSATDIAHEKSTNPQCDALLRLDVGAVCPLLRDRLFRRSEALRPH